MAVSTTEWCVAQTRGQDPAPSFSPLTVTFCCSSFNSSALLSTTADLEMLVVLSE